MKSRELTPEFRKEFVVKIGGTKGKEAVLYNGLLALAHEQENFGHVRAYITQYPNKDNSYTAFARAEIIDKEGNMIGMEEADANEKNCGKMTALSFPRMACTRAKARAFRDYLNVAMVCSDEIPSAYEPDLATPKQIGKIKSMARKMDWKKSKLFKFVYAETGTDALNELTEAEADRVIKALEEKLQNVDENEEDIDFSEDE